jgi:hypothetical protein
MSMLKTRAAQMAGGGTRSDSKQPNQKINWDDPRQVVPMYQDFASQGVKALGEQSAFDFRRELGAYLGGLNSTGALRSGAVESGANDIMNTYSRNFASAASQATLGAIGYGQERVGQQLDAERAAADRKQANKSSIWGGVGSLLGAGIGLFGGKK